MMLKGADPLKTCHRFEDQTTPLHKAIQMGDDRFVKSFVDVIEKDLRRKQAMLQTTCNGVTPLLE